MATPADARRPQRRCIVTSDVRDRAALLRFVVGPTGEIVPDIAARLPGRGLWLTPRRDIVERAAAKRLFARAARRPVAVPSGLADLVEELLARRCVESLGLARRAGLAVAGFDRVEEAVRSGKAGVLVLALDGAVGRRHRFASQGRALPSARVLMASEIGAAFGRDRAVHAAVRPGSFCGRIWLDAQRLAGFRAEASLTSDDDLLRPAPEQDAIPG
ncbi:MAG: RNA-binding protein [Alphaproteobacteria bacterium]|nr:RNA-binding protein [Alphaproteobacteria bacterium]